MIKRMALLTLMCSFFWLTPSMVRGEAAKDVIIIVHADNPDSALSKKDISKIFLKKIKKWKSTDENIAPVDQIETSKIRENFSDKIHDKTIAAIKSYWQKQIFSGRSIPPVEKESDDDVITFVSEHQNAIGYVSSRAKVQGKGVKIIQVEDVE